MKKEFTQQDMVRAANEERRKHLTILNYILNKNSHPLSMGGVNYEKLFDDLQDYESYLNNNI